MIARFLQDIVVNDIEKNMEMTIDKGEELCHRQRNPL